MPKSTSFSSFNFNSSMMKYNTQQRIKKNPQHCHTKSLSLLIPSPKANATRNKLYETNKIQKELDYVKKSLQIDTRESNITTTISSRNHNPNSRCFSNRSRRLNCSACEITSKSPTQRFVEKGDLMKRISKNSFRNSNTIYNNMKSTQKPKLSFNNNSRINLYRNMSSKLCF